MRSWGLFILCAALLAVPALADVAIFSPGRDNSLYSDNADATNGGNPWLYVGKTQNGESRNALIGFDVSSIPVGSTIDAVTLTLNVLREGIRGATLTDSFDVHRLSADWGEGTVNGGPRDGIGRPANPGDATWNSNFHTISTWNTPGGDFVAQPSASTIIDFKVSQLGQPAPVSWSDSGLIADVQSWVDDPAHNYGWLLRADDNNPSESARAFAAREHDNVTLRPQLRVTYTPIPEPGTLAMLASTMAFLVCSRRDPLIHR